MRIVACLFGRCVNSFINNRCWFIICMVFMYCEVISVVLWIEGPFRVHSHGSKKISRFLKMYLDLLRSMYACLLHYSAWTTPCCTHKGESAKINDDPIVENSKTASIYCSWLQLVRRLIKNNILRQIIFIIYDKVKKDSKIAVYSNIKLILTGNLCTRNVLLSFGSYHMRTVKLDFSGLHTLKYYYNIIKILEPGLGMHWFVS